MKFLLHKKINRRNIRAFTLLETLSSIAIISAVILGPLTFAVNSSSYARQTKDMMTVTYLAEESLELLHHQYDSLYLSCLHGVIPCDSSQILPGETIGETAWRLFKTRLDAYPTCFSSSGCTYDFIDLSTDIISPPTKYSPTSSECSELSLRYDTMMVDGDLINILRRFYVCKLVTTHINSTNLFADPGYKRKIIIKSIPTFTESVVPVPDTANLGLYHDDLRVTVFMSFKRSNGMSRTIHVVDFLHARE